MPGVFIKRNAVYESLYTTSKDLNQPGHLHSLIRAFAVCIYTDLNCSQCAVNREGADWAVQKARSFSWFGTIFIRL